MSRLIEPHIPNSRTPFLRFAGDAAFKSMQEDVYANSGDMYALVLDAWEEDGSNVSANSCHLAMFPD